MTFNTTQQSNENHKTNVQNSLKRIKIENALNDAHTFYCNIRNNNFDNFIEELNASKRLHKLGKLPDSIAINNLSQYSTDLDDMGFQARSMEIDEIIDDIS